MFEKIAKLIVPGLKQNHILIEGDNLPVLYCLKDQYKQKINMIYIDPPYNSGYNIFTYKDKFVDYEQFMLPRLSASKELLTDDGLIFISISTNGMLPLRAVCDKVFGENNFVEYLFWKTKAVRGQARDGVLVNQIEYILIYSKNIELARINKITNPKAGEISWQPFIKGGGQWQRKYRPKQYFPFYLNQNNNTLSIEKQNDDDILIYPLTAKGEEGFWQNGVETTTEKLTRGLFRAKKTKTRWMIEQHITGKATTPAGNLIDNIPSVEGTNELKRLGFNFTNPKPVRLMRFLLDLGSNKDSIVLDYFAGSGSFGAAVIEKNKEDDGNRKFILITNNEANICSSITYPRLEIMIKECCLDSNTTEGNLSYFRFNDN